MEQTVVRIRTLEIGSGMPKRAQSGRRLQNRIWWNFVWTGMKKLQTVKK